MISFELDTTIAANEQALAALKALYAETPSQDMAVAIGTLEQTIEAQKQIAASMKDGGQLKDGAAALSAGAGQLGTGAAQVNAGAGALSAGAKEVSGGLGRGRQGSCTGRRQALGLNCTALTGGEVSIRGSSKARRRHFCFCTGQRKLHKRSRPAHRRSRTALSRQYIAQ